MERWIWFLGMAVFYGVLFLWFLNQVKKPDYKKNYVLVKTLQSAAFVSVFLAAAVVSRDILDFWLMLPAFVCCFAGDVILAFYNKIKKKRLFLLGLVTFLMGHLFFIRWLDRMQPEWAAFILEDSGHAFWSTLFLLHTCLQKACILQ